MVGVEPESPSQARSFRVRSSPTGMVSIHSRGLELSSMSEGRHTLPWAIHGGSRRKTVMVVLSLEAALQAARARMLRYVLAQEMICF